MNPVIGGAMQDGLDDDRAGSLLGGKGDRVRKVDTGVGDGVILLDGAFARCARAARVKRGREPVCVPGREVGEQRQSATTANIDEGLSLWEEEVWSGIRLTSIDSDVDRTGRATVVASTEIKGDVERHAPAHAHTLLERNCRWRVCEVPDSKTEALSVAKSVGNADIRTAVGGYIPEREIAGLKAWVLHASDRVDEEAVSRAGATADGRKDRRT